MPDPSTYRPAPGTIPVEAGVYRFRDARGRVIYVGKAKSLRQRLNSYFADVAALHPRTRQMVTTAASVEWTVVQTEVEALQLEYTWIKEFDPRFNVRYRDDKSYPSLAVTLYEEYPRLQVMRGPKRKGVRYFGPYSHAWAIRETLDLLLRVFPARTCSAGVFKRAGQIGRPCLLGYIGKCSAPCVGRVSADEHRRIVDDFCDFMAGKTDVMIRRLERQMAEASAQLEFERAARLRDDLDALRRAMEKQAVVFGDGTDADVVAFAEDDLEAAVQVFHVRGGRVRGQRGWVVDKAATVDGTADRRTSSSSSSRSSTGPADGEGGDRTARDSRARSSCRSCRTTPTCWPNGCRAARAAGCRLRVPQRGDKRALMETVARNAAQAFAQHKLKRASDLTARSQALERAAGRARPGRGAAAHRVLRRQPRAGHQRGRQHGRVRGRPGPQERVPPLRDARRRTATPTGSPRSVRRRFARYLDEQVAVGATADAAAAGRGGSAAASTRTTGRPRKFAYPPNLRRRRRRRAAGRGGAGRARRARHRRRRAGRAGQAAGGGVAAGRAVPGDPAAHAPRGLYLLQRVRDEAHRFAITFHRQTRSKAMTTSALDGIPGLGETRRKALLARLRLAQAAAGGVDGGLARGSRHRAADRRGDRGGPRCRSREPGAGGQRHDRRSARDRAGGRYR